MVLIVETGSGNPNADSYRSIADATAYLQRHGEPVAWFDATLESQERAMRNAARYMTIVYGDLWVGRRRFAAQSLDWPRLDAEDDDGFVVGSSSVPAAVGDAQTELAVRDLQSSDGLLADREEPASIEEESIQVGSIRERIRYSGSKSQVPLYPKIDGIVARYTVGANSMERA